MEAELGVPCIPLGYRAAAGRKEFDSFSFGPSSGTYGPSAMHGVISAAQAAQGVTVADFTVADQVRMVHATTATADP